MLSVVTNINTDHLVPNVDPVPPGIIDAFGRDDGWMGDRPADCGNFWLDRSNVDDPCYLSAGRLTMTPGVGSFLGSIWLGGSDISIAFDMNTGPSLSITQALFCYFVADQRPEYGGLTGVEQVILSLFSGVSRLQRSSAAVLTDVSTGAGSSPSTAYRVYISAQERGGSWYVRVDRSAVDGSGRALLVSGVVTSPAVVGWLSFATSAGMTGVTVDNVERFAVTAAAPYVTAFATDGIDAGWRVEQGTWSTDSAGAYSVTGNDSDAITRDFGQADMITRTTIAAFPTGIGAAPIVRFADVNNYFLLELDRSTNVMYLIRKLAGAFTTLTSTGFGYVAGDTFELSALGDLIGVRQIRSGSPIVTFSVTDTHLATATRCGFRTSYNSSGGVRFSDFSVYG